jgi:hypothetical protein
MAIPLPATRSVLLIHDRVNGSRFSHLKSIPLVRDPTDHVVHRFRMTIGLIWVVQWGSGGQISWIPLRRTPFPYKPLIFIRINPPSNWGAPCVSRIFIPDPPVFWFNWSSIQITHKIGKWIQKLIFNMKTIPETHFIHRKFILGPNWPIPVSIIL